MTETDGEVIQDHIKYQVQYEMWCRMLGLWSMVIGRTAYQHHVKNRVWRRVWEAQERVRVEIWEKKDAF